MTRSLVLASLGMLLALSVPPALGATDSAYSDINLDECLILHADDFGAEWACPGYRGYPLWLSEGDLRFFISFGFGAPDEMSASQTLPQFNYLGDKLEWRLTNQTGDFKPFAAIVRYYLDEGTGEDTDKSQLLAVIKIEPGNTCHIGYVDPELVPNANARAREIADSTAPDFDCKNDEPVLIPS